MPCQAENRSIAPRGTTKGVSQGLAGDEQRVAKGKRVNHISLSHTHGCVSCYKFVYILLLLGVAYGTPESWRPSFRLPSGTGK